MYREEDGLKREPDETVLDACLEEILGGQTPPDLSAQILAAHARQQAAAAGNGTSAPSSPAAASLPVSPPLAEPPVAAPPVQQTTRDAAVVPSPRSTTASAARHRQRYEAAASRQWFSVAMVATVLVAGFGVALAALAISTWRDAPLEMADSGQQPDDAHRPAVVDPGGDEGGQPEHDETPPLPEVPFAENVFGAGDLADADDSGVPWQLPYPVEPQPEEKIVAFVDEQIKRGWAQAGVRPAPPVSDAQWCRRVYQQLLGRPPSDEELQQFAQSSNGDRRQRLVDQLLHGPQYRREFARHWAGVWTDALLGPAISPGKSQLASREGLRQYLHQSLLDNKPHDQLTTELIAATGTSTPGAPQFNGATNFVLSGVQADKAHLAAAVGRVFLGRQAQCAQCHDHPGGEMSQQQFWQLAAFFQQAAPQRDESSGVVRLANVDYSGETGDADEAEIFYQADRQKRIAYPVFIDGTRVSPSGRLADVDRRAELARLIVGSEDYSLAVVNRLWQQMLGRPLADSTAQAPAESSHPELWQGLSEQFAAGGFDQTDLLQWIALSEANARSSEAGESPDSDALLAERPLFHRFYGEESAQALPYNSVAEAMDAARRGARPVEATRPLVLARIATLPGQGDADGNSSIFIRSDELSPEADGDAAAAHPFVERMIVSDMAFADKVEHLYLHGVGRRPTQAELSAAQRDLARHEGSVAGALHELWWAVENSREHAQGR